MNRWVAEAHRAATLPLLYNGIKKRIANKQVCNRNEENPMFVYEKSTNATIDDKICTQQSTSLALPSACLLSNLSLSVLAERCMQEIDNYRRGEPSNDHYGVELFRRALKEHDPPAWEVVQQQFNDILLRWLRSHPLRDSACLFDSEENYVAQTFARFWLATVSNQEIEFRTLAAALRYLRASLHGAILDTLRAYSRPHEVPLPEPGEAGEPLVEEWDDGQDLWEVIQSLIPDERELRVAYLIFHCGLKPREIVHFCSEEFCGVKEIY